MYCPKCGWNNADNVAKCANCSTELIPQSSQPQQPPQQSYSQQQFAAPHPALNVPDNMVWSIVITIVSLICCCYLPLPVAFGIVAIVKSSQANNKKMMGDYLGALRDSNAARTWIYWAVGLDAAGLIGWIIFCITTAMRSGGANHSF